MSRKKRRPEQRDGAKKSRRPSGEVASIEPSSPKWKSAKTLVGIATVLLVTFAAFTPVLDNQFTNWDDPLYVTENPYIRSLSGDSLRTLFSPSVTFGGNYQPLTILSLALDYRRAGLEPSAYLATNRLLHVLNTLLVFTFFLLLSRGKAEIALIVSLFFGIHPMHVESVAWASGRKDLVYSLFFLLALINYLGYLRPGLSSGKRSAFYVLTTLFFVASLLSKPAAVVLPVVLLLIDYFRERRISGRVLLEKSPLFLLSLILGAYTIQAQSVTAMAHAPDFGFLQRIMIPCYAIVMYLVKFLVPIDLSAFYPYPAPERGFPFIFGLAPFIVLALTALVIRSGSRTRVGVFGAGLFLVSLALVLQFIGVGGAIMADRYTYLSYLGPLFIVAAAYSFARTKEGAAWAMRRAVFTGLLATYALVFAFGTYQRSAVWKDSLTLWTDVIDRHPDAVPAIAYYNRGDAYAGLGQDDRAIEDYNEALARNPEYVGIYVNRGAAFNRKGMYEAALIDFGGAIGLDPDYPNTYASRAQLYLDTEQFEKAIADLDRYLQLEPRNPDAHRARGIARRNLRQYRASLADFDHAIDLRPGNGQFLLSRSRLFDTLGQWGKALEDARQAGRLGATVPREYIDGLEESRRRAADGERVAALRRSVEIEPDDRSHRVELAKGLVVRNELDDAEAVMRASVERWPCEVEFRTELAVLALRTRGRAAQVAVLEEFVANCQAPPEILNDLAYLLAVVCEPEVRDGPRALRLAEQAVAAYEEHPLVLDTLAVAYGANGRFDEALEVSQRAVSEGEKLGLPDSTLKTMRAHHATLATGSPICQ